MGRIRGALLVPLLAFLLAAPSSYAQTAAPAPSTYGTQLSVAQIRAFLKDARVVRTRGTPKGVTAPKRLTQRP